MDNVIDLKKRAKKMTDRKAVALKEWQKPAEEPKTKEVKLVAVEMATLLYNLVQSNLQMLERLEEITDMLTHTEYQVDCLRNEVAQLTAQAIQERSLDK